MKATSSRSRPIATEEVASSLRAWAWALSLAVSINADRGMLTTCWISDRRTGSSGSAPGEDRVTVDRRLALVGRWARLGRRDFFGAIGVNLVAAALVVQGPDGVNLGPVP